MKRLLFIEGGGDNNASLSTECRRGFSLLLGQAGLRGRMPRIIACGGRHNTYKQFCTALAHADPGDVLVLLVDAEAPVSQPSTAPDPWHHVQARRGDRWERPEGAQDQDLHFMVECMENWFLADPEALASFYGPKLQRDALPTTDKPEHIAKAKAYQALKRATLPTQKGAYGKGAHSFKILALVNPHTLRRTSPWAKRLLDHLQGAL